MVLLSLAGWEGQAQLVLNIDICLFFLGCAVMNGTSCSCKPCCDQKSREGRMHEAGLTHLHIPRASLFPVSMWFSSFPSCRTQASFCWAKFPQISTTPPCTIFSRQLLVSFPVLAFILYSTLVSPAQFLYILFLPGRWQKQRKIGSCIMPGDTKSCCHPVFDGHLAAVTVAAVVVLSGSP